MVRSAFAVAVLALVISGCATAAITAPTASVAALTTATPNPTPAADADQLSVGETPWWQAPRPSASTTPSPGRSPQPQHFVLSGNVLFQPDSPVLTPGAATQLAVVLGRVKNHSEARIAVDGYADRAGTGTEAVALRLSIDRARAVQEWLVAHGVPADHLTARGWGDTRPVHPHPVNEAQHAENRRCEITVTGSG